MKNPKLGSVFPAAQGSGACAPETRREGIEITVVVAPTSRQTGRYVARLGERGRVLCKHRRNRSLMLLAS